MVVSVSFPDSPKKYDYLTDLSDLKRGDLVVVPTGPPRQRRFAVVPVVGIKQESEKADKWVVQRVDIDGWQQRIKQREEEEQEFDYLFGLEHEAEMDMIDARRDW